MIANLLHAGVVQEGQQRPAVAVGWRLIVHHGNLDPSGVSTHTQTDERDLDDGQQELEAQGAAEREEKVSPSPFIPCGVPVALGYAPWHPLHPHHRFDGQSSDVSQLGQQMSGSHLPVGWSQEFITHRDTRFKIPENKKKKLEVCQPEHLGISSPRIGRLSSRLLSKDWLLSRAPPGGMDSRWRPFRSEVSHSCRKACSSVCNGTKRGWMTYLSVLPHDHRCGRDGWVAV